MFKKVKLLSSANIPKVWLRTPEVSLTRIRLIHVTWMRMPCDETGLHMIHTFQLKRKALHSPQPDLQKSISLLFSHGKAAKGGPFSGSTDARESFWPSMDEALR